MNHFIYKISNQDEKGALRVLTPENQLKGTLYRDIDA